LPSAAILLSLALAQRGQQSAVTKVFVVT